MFLVGVPQEKLLLHFEESIVLIDLSNCSGVSRETLGQPLPSPTSLLCKKAGASIIGSHPRIILDLILFFLYYYLLDTIFKKL
jgi:hypothetical protein